MFSSFKLPDCHKNIYKGAGSKSGAKIHDSRHHLEYVSIFRLMAMGGGSDPITEVGNEVEKLCLLIVRNKVYNNKKVG